MYRDKVNSSVRRLTNEMAPCSRSMISPQEVTERDFDRLRSLTRVRSVVTVGSALGGLVDFCRGWLVHWSRITRAISYPQAHFGQLIQQSHGLSLGLTGESLDVLVGCSPRTRYGRAALSISLG